jgi:hypothetical protein
MSMELSIKFVDTKKFPLNPTGISHDLIRKDSEGDFLENGDGLVPSDGVRLFDLKCEASIFPLGLQLNDNGVDVLFERLPQFKELIDNSRNTGRYIVMTPRKQNVIFSMTPDHDLSFKRPSIDDLGDDHPYLKAFMQCLLDNLAQAFRQCGMDEKVIMIID